MKEVALGACTASSAATWVTGADAHGLPPTQHAWVAAGANQAFVNIVLTLLDADDRAVLFRPYYFNHLMALQVCRVLLNPR